MTEENFRFESDADETGLPSSSQSEWTERTAASPKTEIPPLIPGTEIIGRRARKAAMMAQKSQETVPEEPEAAPEPEESADQISLLDAAVVDEVSPVEISESEAQISLFDAAPEGLFSEGLRSDKPVAVAEPISTEEIPAAEVSFAAPVGIPEEAPDPLAELFSDPQEIPLRRARRASEEAAPPEDPFVSEDPIPRRRARVTEPPVVKKRPSAVSPFVEFVEIVVGALVAAILVLTLICRTGVVEGSSMVPTMYAGDRYVISDLFYTPDQGDIVVFRPEIDGEDELWIKRVIALEGQTVYIDPTTYRVYVDGNLLDEPYLGGAGTIPHTMENPVTVPEGCVYVLGDNRAISHDSRYEDLGCVEIGQLAGRVILRFWPLESFGFCE